jgi:hypothetical protein
MSARQKKIVWPILAMLIFVSSLVFAAGRIRYGAASTGNRVDARPENTSGISTRTGVRVDPGATVVPQGASARGPVQNVRFTLYDAGIYPREIRVKQGAVAIAIEDRTGHTSGLMIERENGNGVSIGQVKRFTDHWRGRGQFKVQPGRYRVFDTSRPANQARLIVEP